MAKRTEILPSYCRKSITAWECVDLAAKAGKMSQVPGECRLNNKVVDCAIQELGCHGESGQNTTTKSSLTHAQFTRGEKVGALSSRIEIHP